MYRVAAQTMRFLRRNKARMKILIALPLVVVVFLALKKLLITVFLMLISFILSYIVQNIKIRQLGLEFCLFTAVMSGTFYGPFVGFIVGLVSILVHLVLGGFFGPYWLWVIPGYAFAGAAAGLFVGASPAGIGVIITLALNLLMLVFTAAINPENLPNFIPYLITNVLINGVFFLRLAPVLARLV